MCPSTEGINNRKLERTLCYVQGGWQLIQNNPVIYSANMPLASLAAKFPMLTRVMEGERPSAPPWYSITLGDWRQAVLKEQGEGNSLSVNQPSSAVMYCQQYLYPNLSRIVTLSTLVDDLPYIAYIGVIKYSHIVGLILSLPLSKVFTIFFRGSIVFSYSLRYP